MVEAHLFLLSIWSHTEHKYSAPMFVAVDKWSVMGSRDASQVRSIIEYGARLLPR